MKKTNWYFEDFFPGQEIALGSRTVSEEEIIAFATQFDPQPFHVDHDAAANSIFKGVIASGWHTCSMMMRLVVDKLMGEAQTVIKPLGPIFHQVKCISGSTILGSGDVALILDVPALVRQASQLDASRFTPPSTQLQFQEA